MNPSRPLCSIRLPFGPSRLGRNLHRQCLSIVILAWGLTGCANAVSGGTEADASPTAELTATMPARPTLEPTPTSSPEPSTTPPATATPLPPSAVVVADYLNLRAEPNAEATIVTTLVRAEVLTVLGTNEDGSWTHVQAANGEGWVNSTYIQVDQPTESEAAPTAEP